MIYPVIWQAKNLVISPKSNYLNPVRSWMNLILLFSLGKVQSIFGLLPYLYILPYIPIYYILPYIPIYYPYIPPGVSVRSLSICECQSSLEFLKDNFGLPSTVGRYAQNSTQLFTCICLLFTHFLLGYFAVFLCSLVN